MALNGELKELRALVGDVVRAAPAAESAQRYELPMFVVEGVDGAGKTTFADCLVAAAARSLELSLLRLGQRDAIPSGLREIYERQILCVVDAAKRFATLADYILEIAAVDALLYGMRLRTASIQRKPGE